MSLVKTFLTSGAASGNSEDFDISGGYLYILNTTTSYVTKYDYNTGTLISSNLVGLLNGPYRIRCYGNNLYVENGNGMSVYSNTGGAEIGRINLPNPFGLYIYNNIIYAGTYAVSTHIYAYTVSSLSLVSGFTTTNLGTNTQISGITIANNIIYAVDYGNNRISTVNAPTGAIISANFITGLVKPTAVEIYENILYVGFGTRFTGGGNISSYNATTSTVINSAFYNGGNLYSSLRLYNDLLYFGTVSGVFFYTQYIIYPCFKQGTKILTVNPESYQEEYVPVETLKPGDLIKTVESGYKEIHSIGHRTISMPKSDSNPSNRLYKFSPDSCSTIFEPLYITGEHCTLHRDLPKEKLDEVEKHMERIHVTENHYRVPAMLDDRAEPYDLEDEPTTIWHFALDHEDVTFNYGVYANGLLVESCAIESLLEKSGMQLLE
jgi:hypothetical protein